jgi:hypothetical protein
MGIEEYIKQNARFLGFRIMVAPDIPVNKLNNCMRYIVDKTTSEYILIAGDATVFGNGSIGFVLTGEHLYFSNNKGKNKALPIEEISYANYIKKNTTNSDNTFSVGDKIEICMRNGEKYFLEGCMVGFDCKAMEEIINGIVELVDKGETVVSTKQNVAVSELDDEIKLLYLKILCNYAYIGDAYIDSNEYSTIQSIVVRIELGAKARNHLRSYMGDIEHKEKTGDLLYKLKNSLEYGSYDIVKYSIMQDVLYMHSLTYPSQAWMEDGFIGSLLNYLKLRPEQLELMEYAIDLNKEMVSDDANVIKLQNSAKDMAKSAIYLNIPLMTLYCSGSVYNVDTYHKIFNGDEKAKVSIDKQRELMLQTIIKNTQETINHLVTDMNSVSAQLLNEIQKGIQSSTKIEKLSSLLTRLTNGAEAKVKKTESVEKRALYSKIPSILDMAKMEKIRRDKIYDIQYQHILKEYPLDQVSQDRVIRGDIEVSDLMKLINAFEEISYN